MIITPWGLWVQVAIPHSERQTQKVKWPNGIYRDVCLPGFVKICWIILEKPHPQWLWYTGLKKTPQPPYCLLIMLPQETG